MKRLLLCLFALGGASCAASSSQVGFRDPYYDFERSRDMVAQGWLGLSELQSDDFHGGSDLPVVGGAFMQPLFSNGINLGIEGGLGIDWNGHVEAFSAGGGGLVIKSDIDMLLVDFFVGPYGDFVLGQRWRFYGATGWDLQYGRSDADIHDPTTGDVHANADAFGGGYYARTGIEYVLPSGASFGFGVRYVDTNIDFGDQIGSLDLSRVQWLFTLTRNY